MTVKSGDWVDYTTNFGFPCLLDAALAKRKDELRDVKIRGNLCFGPIQAVEIDPDCEHFLTTAGIAPHTSENCVILDDATISR